MNIRCPVCQFEREIKQEVIPASASVATCPRCNARFRFREAIPRPVRSSAPLAVSLPSELRASPGEREGVPSAASADRHAYDDAASADRHAQEPRSASELRASPGEREGVPSAASADRHEYDDAASADRHDQEPRSASELGASPGEREGVPSAASADRHEYDDDPLPPGAVIPQFDLGFESEEESASAPDVLPAALPDALPGSLGLCRPAHAETPGPLRREATPAPEYAPGSAGAAGSARLPSPGDLPFTAGRAQEAEAAAPAGAGLSLTAGRPARSREDAGEAWRDEGESVPWEHASRYGLAGAFVQTVLQTMFRPRAMFRAVGREAPVTRAALFYIILNCFSVLMTQLWSLGPFSMLGANVGAADMRTVPHMMLESMSTPLLLLLVPFLLLLRLFVLAAFFQAMLRLTQPDKADFNITLRVLAYSAAPSILCAVPVLGGRLAYLLYWALCFAGCRFALGLSWHKTLLALAPLYIVGFALLLRFQMSFLLN